MFGSLRHCDVYQMYFGTSILLKLRRQRGLFVTPINLSLHLNSCIFLQFLDNVVMRCDVIAPPFMQIVACKFVHRTSELAIGEFLVPFCYHRLSINTIFPLFCFTNDTLVICRRIPSDSQIWNLVFLLVIVVTDKIYLMMGYVAADFFRWKDTLLPC